MDTYKNILIAMFCVIGCYHLYSEKPQETTQEIKGVSEGVQDTQKPRETKENAKETISEIISETPKRRPLTFKKFRVIVEILCDGPKDDEYVQKEIKRLINLAKSVSDAQDIKIINLQGISRKEEAFDINLD